MLAHHKPSSSKQHMKTYNPRHAFTAALLAAASLGMSQVAQAAMIQEPTFETAAVAPVTTLVLTPQSSVSPMNRITARDDGYPQFTTTPVAIGTDYFAVEVHLSDNSPFKLFSGSIVAHRFGFADVIIPNFAGATFSDPASPLYRMYDALGNDVSVNGALLTSVTGTRFVVSNFAPSPSGVTAPGRTDSADWTLTVTQVSSSTNFANTGTTSIAETPEPSAIGSLMLGGLGLVGMMRRRRSSISA